MTPEVSISLHDVAPATWPECKRLLSLTDAFSVPVSLLVVPRFHGGLAADADRDFRDAIHARVRQGDEVLLHGDRHLDEARRPRTPGEWIRRRLLTNREGEFSALSYDEASLKLRQGVECLTRLDVPIAGFVPPAWQMSESAWQAWRDSDLEYTCTRDRLVRRADGKSCMAPSLVWSTRNAWRRVVSKLWNTRRLIRLSAYPLVRVALHPEDARHPSSLVQMRSVLAALCATRVPTLESSYLKDV
jgi:uncharacterized protein